MNPRSILGLLALTLLCTPAGGSPWGYHDYLTMKRLQGTATEYCHLVRFPQGWTMPRLGPPFDKEPLVYLEADYDIRQVSPGSDKFLIRAIQKHRGIPTPTLNVYLVDLANPSVVPRPASPVEWAAAEPIALNRTPIGIELNRESAAKFKGFTFPKTADRWATYAPSRLSPASSWLVLQSADGKQMSAFGIKYRVVFDMYSTETGRKLATIETTYSGIGNNPDECAGRAAWLTDRFFLIPLGKQAENCLVCEFVKPSQLGGSTK